MPRTTALVPLADGFEEIEAATVIDLLRRAGIEVVVASLGPTAVRGAHGLGFAADATLDAALGADYDLVVLPGGEPGATALRDDARVRALLQRQAAGGRLVAAICAAPKVLAAAGLLDGRDATSYPGYLDQQPAPGMRYHARPVVIDGRIVTSRGPGTAMEFALALIEQLLGAAKRAEVEAPLLR
jgi:4-methyl-5(b-hydroxyethyl)-thiazole monophosphate biosynthesis